MLSGSIQHPMLDEEEYRKRCIAWDKAHGTLKENRVCDNCKQAVKDGDFSHAGCMGEYWCHQCMLTAPIGKPVWQCYRGDWGGSVTMGHISGGS